MALGVSVVEACRFKQARHSENVKIAGKKFGEQIANVEKWESDLTRLTACSQVQ